MYIINIHIHCHVLLFLHVLASPSLRSPKITNTFTPRVIAVEHRRARARAHRAHRDVTHGHRRLTRANASVSVHLGVKTGRLLSASVIPAVAYTTAHPTTAMPEKKGHARGTSRTSAVKKL